MSRESMLLLAGGSVIIAFMVLYYDSQHIGVKGVNKGKVAAFASKQSASDEADNSEQTDNDNNTMDQMAPAAGKSVNGAKKGPKKPQISRERFVAFDAWPTASNNCPNKPGELPTQDVNQESQSANTGQIASGASTPQSVLYDELKSTSELYQGLTNQLDKQSINVTEYNTRIRGLQREYNEKIKTLFQKKQKIDATQKLIDNGTVTPEEGKTIMWQLVLPNETMRAISAKPKVTAKQPPVAKPVYGTVTGITHNNEDPMVMIDGEIYHEGASIRGVKIAKINQQSVDFEYKGFTWNQGVNDSPSPNWP